MTTVRDFLPPNYLSDDFNVLPALLDAIETGDEHVLDILTQARAQLFLISAGGSYLTNLANQYGFAVPPNSGLDEAGFRRLAIPSIWSPKQSIPTINKITELFYGTAVLHPSVTATVSENYALQDGDDLFFETEAGVVNVLFESEKFSDIGNLSASEIAAAINTQSKGLVFADVILNRTTSLNQVRVISLAFGSAAKIRVIGGSAQNVIKFGNLAETTAATGTEWNIDKQAGAVYANRARFTWSGVGANPSTYNVNVGDFVSIRNLVDGIADFSKLNGSYEVLDVGANYFEIENLDFQNTGVTYTQTADNQIIFTSKDFQTLFDNDELAVVSETTPGELDISVPAVPPIVRRQLQGAARLRGSTEQFIEFRQNQIVVPFPNDLPDSGTVVLKSARFGQGFNGRFIRYSSKLPPSGNEQVLNVDSTGPSGVPFLTSGEADTALSIIPSRNPIFGDIDNPDIEIQTPNVRHNFENAQEITIEGASVDIELFKHKTVPAILCPVGQDEQYFEHDMDSDQLYIQFYDEDTLELMHIVYRPDPVDPLNRTRFNYLPELEGRFLKAVIIEIIDGSIPGDPTASFGPFPINAGDSTDIINDNLGTTFKTFQTIDTSDNHNITGLRKVNAPNQSEFSYTDPTGVVSYKPLFIDYQEVFPTLVRAVATNFLLPASAGTNSVTLVHNLFSTSLVVELRVADSGTTALEQDTFFFFPKIIITNDTSFEIEYSDLPDDIRVDVFITASFFNPLESVHGGILPADLNKEHIVREKVNEDDFRFRILGTGIAPIANGQITSQGKTVLGVGTSFLTDVGVGNFIAIPNGQKRLVDSIVSDTELKLTQAFNPSQGTPIQYRIISPSQNDTPHGEYVKYNGAIIFGFNVTYDPDFDRGTDIRFEFPDRVSRQSAGFVDGTAVRILEGFGFDLQGAVASYLRTVDLTVHSQDLNFVYFKANIGATPGNIIQGAKCRRSGFFGGSSYTHFLAQPLSQNNQTGWFKEASVQLLDSNLPPNEEYLGSYLYDIDGTVAPFSVGSTSAVLLDSVTRLSAPGVLNVDSVADFPNSGYIFLDFGNDSFEGPIPYRLKIEGSPDQIVLDPAYIFKRTHSDNSIVRLATSITKLELSTNASEYPVYLTGVVEARRTLETILADIVSVGVKLNINVQIPELRYDEPSLQPFL